MTSKSYILATIEQGWLNREWALLNLLAHLSEADAQEFCRKHNLSGAIPWIDNKPLRTVEDAIDELYARRWAELKLEEV